MSSYLVAGLSDADMVWLLSRGKLRTLRPGERLVETGRAPAELFFVLAGTLEVVRGDGACVATLGPGEVIGEMSFVDDHPPIVSVRARERCELLGTPREAIVARFGEEQAFATRFYRALAVFLSHRLRDTTAALGHPVVPAPGGAGAASVGERLRRLVASIVSKPG